MMKSQEQFLEQLRNLLGPPVTARCLEVVLAIATIIFPRLLRLQRARISHRVHPLRVIHHILLGLEEKPQAEAAVMALLIAGLCHDLSALPKITTGDEKKRRSEKERGNLRNEFRLRHEAEGAIQMVEAVAAAEELLWESGQTPIGDEALQICYQICVNHDSPSRRRKLPLDPRHPAAEPLELFVQADGITMIEYGGGLKSDVPLGPVVERWTKGEAPEAGKVAEQLAESERSLGERLRTAFDLPATTPLEECFRSRAMGRLAVRSLADWQAELG
jgi:hypothetical protein